MSSPAGVQFSQVDFLSRWMPSSSRAGVILSPNPDLAGSLRLLSPTLKPLKPDDSFSSDFAPLPASADSSCLVAEGCARSAGTERTELSVYGGDEMEGNSQDLPLMMKLEQLRKWQQHMQQQLKAHQLEELLRLQEEQQRLLVKMNSSRDAAAAAADDSVGSDWEEEEEEEEEETTLPAASHHRRSPSSSNMNSSTCGLRQERHVSPAAERQRQRHRGQEVNDEDAWNSTDDDDDDRDQSSVSSHHQDDDDTLTSGDVRKEDKLSQDRPIKPGIGGHKQTFEELLEEQLRLEEQRLKSARQQQNDDGAITSPAPPKRSFLKRGEGLSRFTNKSKASLKRKQEVKPQFKPPPQIRAIPRSSLAPGAQQRGATSCVQRKTAVINKENRPRGVRSPPHHDDAAQSKTTRTKVLGNDQRQNTDGSESVQTEPKLSQNHKTVGSEPQPSAGAERSSGSKVEAGGGAAGLETLELSLQRWECDRRRESVELGEFELLEQAAEELSFSSNSSFVLKVLQMDQQQRQLQAHGLHQRRLSSTPIKSPPSAPPQRSSSANGGVSVDSGAFELKNKASGEDEERQDEEENCEEEQEVSVKPPVFPAAFCFPQSKPPYDKRTYQDEDDDSNVDESTLMEDEDDNEQRRRVVFDDDDTWNDLEETSVDPHDDSRGVSPVSETMDAAAASAPQMTTTTTRKVAQSKVVEVEKVPPPTTSQLMTRLFPSLRTKTQNTTTTPHLPHRRSAPLPPPESREPEEETVQQVQSRQLRERLVELEMEIDRFKRENAAVAKLRQDNEKTQENLRKERLEFERWKTEEQVKLEELKKEENKKLQKERKLFEKHVTAARAVPDKKEREEIQALKQQLSSLQEELRRKESRWTSTHGRLRQQIDSLSQDNAALQDQIHVLEKLRLSSWKKTSVPPEKETKDVSTTSTNVSSVTKGVKFASPLDSRAGSSVGPQNAVAASGRRSSGETSHNSTGMKSSLRRPSAPNTSSSCRRTQQKSPPPSSNSQDQDQDQDQDKPSKQEESNSCSTKRDFVPEEPERSDVEETGSVEEVVTHPDGKVEKVLVGGDRLIVFPNGTKKEVSCDGRTVKVTFFNGDTKQITADHRVIYHYSDAQTTHITYPDGLEVLHFPNNQTEKLFPDGRKEITFPDQTVKTLFSDGREESVLTDGTIIQVDTDGTKHIHFNTGQKEIHTSDYKRREYPDGTVKTVYTDGRQETRYPTGRVRVKDKDGNVVTDTRV